MGSLSSFLRVIQSGENLSASQAEEAVSFLMKGEISPEETKQFLLALRQKGEALEEVVGAARAMRAHAVRVQTAGITVDTCGTGGDGLKTPNISTLAALVVATSGVKVAKHGNRSITSSCGSADLLEALGVAIDVDPQVAQRSFNEAGFAFLFAPRFHPAMKVVAPIRKELRVPTIFNLLGPLTNPAGVRFQVVGVADAGKLELYAQALIALDAERFLVVRGDDGQDEISTTGPTRIIEFNRKMDPVRVARYEIVPETFGIRRISLSELRGGTPAENAEIAQGFLSGARGPVRDAVLLNAAAALYVTGVAGDISMGLTLAGQALDQGRAKALLEKVKAITCQG